MSNNNFIITSNIKQLRDAGIYIGQEATKKTMVLNSKLFMTGSNITY